VTLLMLLATHLTVKSPARKGGDAIVKVVVNRCDANRIKAKTARPLQPGGLIGWAFV
jgi:hypothetical protein